MSSVSTFGTFTTARLGIYAAQKGLQITGNNISNINTVGYTRQVLDQISLRTGGSDRYASHYDTKVGNGALCTGVSQIRDPYLDIRYRNEAASVGMLDAKLSGLNNLASILDEVGKGEDEHGVIDAQFSDFFDALHNLKNNTGQEEFDTQVKSSASTLVTLFNTYAKRLAKEEENAAIRFEKEVDTVNKLLKNIQDLNSSIRKSDIHGDNALEQRDERNRLLDELSEYMKIDVTYSLEDLGQGFKVEKLTVSLAGVNPSSDTDRAVLIDGVYATQLSVDDSVNPHTNAKNYDITFGELTDLRGRLKTSNKVVSDPEQLADETAYNAAIQALEDDPAYEKVGDVYRKKTSDGKGNGKVEEISFTKTVTTDGQGNVLSTSYAKVVTNSDYVSDAKLDDNDLYGKLQAQREMLTEAGEFTTEDTIMNVDESGATKRGIPYYRKSLDLLANQFARLMNEANQGYQMDEEGNYLDADGEILTDAAGKALNKDSVLTDDQKAILEAQGVKMGGVLFSSKGDDNDPNNITAENFYISKDWADGKTQIVSTYISPVKMKPGTTDSSNIVHMVALMSTKTDYLPSSIDPKLAPAGGTGEVPLFHGTFQEMLGNIQSVLGNDQKSTDIQLNNYYTSAVELDTQRDSVSSVDLNDEAMNLMQYQKSYAAACRLMTAVDEVLDKLINGTGIVGR